jgi:uncharacterized protein YyaL (SSP411 family)
MHRPLLLLGLAGLCLHCRLGDRPLANRLSQAPTPYASRGASQPVSWQPWGSEAFQLAQRLDRPVLLFVGADGCAWCDSMDLRVYRNAELATLIDSLFVPIRLDRDAHPDVARRYQAAVEVLVGLRGLPLTVVLTPDGDAFFGGTYFPADDPVTGRGLTQLLPQVAANYRARQGVAVRRGAYVRQYAVARPSPPFGVLNVTLVEAEVARLRGEVEHAVAVGRFKPTLVHAQAVCVLLGEFARAAEDSASIRIADRALGLLTRAYQREGPAEGVPELVEAALVRALVASFALSGERSRASIASEFAGHLLERVGNERDATMHVFADREAYVLGVLFDALPALSDTGGAKESVRIAAAALDRLLGRVYRPGRGVAHLQRVGSGDNAPRDLLQDQVQVALAALSAYQATGRDTYLAVARDLADDIEARFADPTGGYFDVAVVQREIPAMEDRQKEILDERLPSANAAVARLYFGLAAATGEAVHRRRAVAVLEIFAGLVQGAGTRAASYLAVAAEAVGMAHRD